MISLILLLPVLGFTQQAPAEPATDDLSRKTLFAGLGEKPKDHVLSPVWLSADGKWRAYVEVNINTKEGMNTTRLWLSRANAPYRLVYFMPPTRTEMGNGMAVFGWAKDYPMLLVLKEEWQWGSDARDIQGVLGIEAATGLVYEPNLDEMLEAHPGKQCVFRVTDAGVSADSNVIILVRARFSTWHDFDETEADVPPAKRCGNFEETWSFNYATGDINQVENSRPLNIFKKFLPDRKGR